MYTKSSGSEWIDCDSTLDLLLVYTLSYSLPLMILCGPSLHRASDGDLWNTTPCHVHNHTIFETTCGKTECKYADPLGIIAFHLFFRPSWNCKSSSPRAAAKRSIMHDIRQLTQKSRIMTTESPQRYVPFVMYQRPWNPLFVHSVNPHTDPNTTHPNANPDPILYTLPWPSTRTIGSNKRLFRS
jgi:hypothetical protein